MSKRIGILGTGAVGTTLALGLSNLGYDVRIGSRTGKDVDGWDGAVGTFAEVVQGADIIVLALKGTAAEAVVTSLKDVLSGKTVIDTTNPIAEQPAENGVLTFFTGPNDSLMERLQQAASDAHLVKAFSCIGSPYMVNPDLNGEKPTMFICGNDDDAKQTVTDLLEKLGWDSVEDMGSAVSARAIEPLCILWCIPGLLHNQWSHAFKMIRA